MNLIDCVLGVALEMVRLNASVMNVSVAIDHTMGSGILQSLKRAEKSSQSHIWIAGSSNGAKCW
jgi:hypothetical protein